MKIHVKSETHNHISMNLVCYDGEIHPYDWYFKQPQNLTKGRTIDLNPEGLCTEANQAQFLINIWDFNNRGFPDSYIIITNKGEIVKQKENNYKFNLPIPPPSSLLLRPEESEIFQLNISSIGFFQRYWWVILLISILILILLFLISFSVYKYYT